MKGGLPEPSDILEELAEKVLDQLERLSVNGFDSALGEMVEYHRFLLRAYSTKTEEGEPFSYAEIEDFFRAPHQEWTREYRRLFERAVNRLDHDIHFVSKLTDIPTVLLSGLAPSLSRKVVESILDIGIILVGRFENWVTKRLISQSGEEPIAKPAELAGSDKTSYNEAIFDFVGSWETTLQYGPSFYLWDRDNSQTNEIQWDRLRKSWPFFKRHLRNTAYFVAAAVWNNDEVGALRFQEMLVRWPRAFDYALPDNYYLARSYLFPTMLDLRWSDFQNDIRKIQDDFLSAEITPAGYYKVIVSDAHNDALLVTIAVILRWFAETKQPKNIAITVASRLLSRETQDPEEDQPRRPTNFSVLFLDLVRLELSGSRYDEQGYGSEIDSIVATLDRMTERDVIPGRIFTPSTIRGRGELTASFLAILLSKVPDQLSENLFNELTFLAKNQTRLPGGDKSLKDLEEYFTTLLLSLNNERDKIISVVRRLDESKNTQYSIAKLQTVLERARSIIETRRLDRINQESIDRNLLEPIRDAVERELFASSTYGIFENVEIRTKPRSNKKIRYPRRMNDIPKGAFTSPQLDWSSSWINKAVQRSLLDWSRRLVWIAFWRKKRKRTRIQFSVSSSQFWDELANFASIVGDAPVLLVPDTEWSSEIQKWSFNPARAPAGIQVEHLDAKKQRGSSYLATINGINIYRGGLNSGNLTLFSSRILSCVTYERLSRPNHVVHFEIDEASDPWKFSLVTHLKPHFLWRRLKIYEISTSKIPPNK